MACGSSLVISCLLVEPQLMMSAGSLVAQGKVGPWELVFSSILSLDLTSFVSLSTIGPTRKQEM